MSQTILQAAGNSSLGRIVVPIGRSVLDFPTLAYLPANLSFFIAAVIMVPICYAIAYIIRKIPGVARVH